MVTRPEMKKVAIFLKKRAKAFFQNWLEDFFVLSGIVLILFTTYQKFGCVIGNYLLGFILLAVGFLIAKR